MLSAMNRFFWALVMPAALLVALSAAEGFAAEEEYYPEVKRDAVTSSLFRMGMADREEGDLDAAIESFQTILSNQPLLHRARLELAVAYYQSSRFQEAIANAEQVLADPKTPPKVRVSVLAFLAQVKNEAEEAKKPHHYWSVPVSFGFMYDTNANVGPDVETVGAFELDASAQEESSGGTVLSVGLDHTLKTGVNFGEVQDGVSFYWQSGLNVYQRSYTGDAEEFDLLVYTARTGPSFISSGNWRANFTVQGDSLRYGDEELAQYTYFLPAVTLQFTEAFEITLDGTASQRDYARDQDQGQDSAYLSGRLSLGYGVGEDRFAWQAGLTYFNENADDNQYGNQGTTVFLGINLRLVGKTNLFGTASRESVRYDAPSSGFESYGARSENEWRYTGGLNYTFQEAGVFTDWKVELKGVYADRNSNVGAFDYERTQGFLSFSQVFR